MMGVQGGGEYHLNMMNSGKVRTRSEPRGTGGVNTNIFHPKYWETIFC